MTSAGHFNCLVARRSSKRKTKSWGNSKVSSKSIHCLKILRRVFPIGSWRIFHRVLSKNVSFVSTLFEHWTFNRRIPTANPIRTSKSNWAKQGSTIEMKEYRTRQHPSSEGQTFVALSLDQCTQSFIFVVLKNV